MKLMKPVLWTVLGAVIGAAAVLTASRVEAQQQPTAERIQVSEVVGSNRSSMFGVYFVKDSKSGWCWIGAKDGSNWTALAVAPAAACD